jgi:hypothetical protein
MITVAPRRRNHAASGTQALRVGSITTVSSAPAGSDSHSRCRSAADVRNRRPLQANRPASSARLAWCAARQAMSIPSVIRPTGSSSIVATAPACWQHEEAAPDIR